MCHPSIIGEDIYGTTGLRMDTMAASLYRASVLALYQISIVLGIALLPVALAANRAGISFPVGRVFERIDSVYERTTVED